MPEQRDARGGGVADDDGGAAACNSRRTSATAVRRRRAARAQFDADHVPPPVRLVSRLARRRGARHRQGQEHRRDRGRSPDAEDDRRRGLEQSARDVAAHGPHPAHRLRRSRRRRRLDQRERGLPFPHEAVCAEAAARDDRARGEARARDAGAGAEGRADARHARDHLGGRHGYRGRRPADAQTRRPLREPRPRAAARQTARMQAPQFAPRRFRSSTPRR